MIAYVQIPEFGGCLLYIGKNYLKGFLDSGLSISVDTTIYMEDIKEKEDAELFTRKQWYDIDN